MLKILFSENLLFVTTQTDYYNIFYFKTAEDFMRASIIERGKN